MTPLLFLTLHGPDGSEMQVNLALITSVVPQGKDGSSLRFSGFDRTVFVKESWDGICEAAHLRGLWPEGNPLPP